MSIRGGVRPKKWWSMILELKYSASFHLPDQRFGTNSLIFKGSLLWNSLSDETKTSQSLAIFKQKIRSWDGAHCTCNIC